MRWQVKSEVEDADIRRAREQGRREGREEMLAAFKAATRPTTPAKSGATRAVPAGSEQRSTPPTLPPAPAKKATARKPTAPPKAKPSGLLVSMPGMSGWASLEKDAR